MVGLAKRLASDEYNKIDQLQTTRSRFWALYWGEMVLVEGGDVQKAMIAVRNGIKAWEKATEDKTVAEKLESIKKDLDVAARALDAACREELKSK